MLGIARVSKFHLDLARALLCILILTLSCIPFSSCQSENHRRSSDASNINVTSPSEVEEDDYSDSAESFNSTSWDGHGKHDAAKIGQIVVYFSVVFIALAGVLLKYFVTQYETSQLKAQEQLNYQRLQSRLP